MAILLAAAVLGVAQVDSHSAGPSPESEIPEPPGSGTVVASEVLCVWVPETLAKLAAQQSRSPVAPTHADLRRSLEDLDQRGLWYAVTIRGRQANGAHSDMSFIRHPYDEPQHFQEVLLVLARAGGTSGCDDAGCFSTAAVHMVSDELSRQGPSWLIARLSRPGGMDVESGER